MSSILGVVGKNFAQGLPFVCVISGGLWLLAMIFNTSEISVEIKSTSIIAFEGFAYVYNLDIEKPWYRELPGDSIRNPRGSQLTIYENGQELNQKHALHKQIINVGQGRYSHWNSTLIFSASDNSTPGKNGAVYEIKIISNVKNVYKVLLFLSFSLATFLLVRLKYGLKRALRYTKWVVTTVIVSRAVMKIYLLNYELLLLSWPLCISPDSTSYLEASPIRTLGYPIFLRLMDWSLGGLDNLAIVQVNLYIIGSLFAGYSFYRLTNSAMIGALLALILLRSSVGLNYGVFVLSEAVFLPVLMFHCGFTALYLSSRKIIYLLLAAFFLAVLIQVRPLGLAFLPSFLVISLLFPRLSSRGIFLALAPIMAMYLVVSTYQFSKFNEVESQSLTGYALLGHVLHLDNTSISMTPGSELRRKIGDKVNPIIEKYPEPNFSSEYRKITADNYNQLLWVSAVPMIGNEIRLKTPGLSDYQLMISAGDAAYQIALDIIGDYPVAYATHVLSHFYGMWRNSITRHQYFTKMIATCSEKSMKQTADGAISYSRYFSNDAFKVPSTANQSKTHWELDTPRDTIERAYREYFQVAIIVTIVALPLLSIFGISTTLYMLYHLSMSTGAYYFIVGAFQPSLFRYIDAVEPIQWGILLLASAWILKGFQHILSRFWAELRTLENK